MWLYHLMYSYVTIFVSCCGIPFQCHFLAQSNCCLMPGCSQRLVPWQARCLCTNGTSVLESKWSDGTAWGKGFQPVKSILCRLCYDCYEARNCSQMPVVRTPATLWHLVTGMMSSIRSAPSLREDSPTYLIPPLGSCCKILWKVPALNNLQQFEDPTAQCVLSLTLHGSESGRTRKILKKPRGSCFWILGGNC